MKKFIGPILFIAISLLFFYLPLVLFLAQGFTSEPKMAGEFIYWQIIGKTIVFGLISAFLCALVSTPVAINISFNSRRGASASWIMSLLPMVVNPLVLIFGWIFLLRDSGIVTRIAKFFGGGSLLYTDTAVVIGMLYIGIPIMTFLLVNSMRNVQRNLLTAAGVMGAGNLYIFWHIILPLSKQGYISGFIFVFLSSCGYFIIPSLLGGGRVTFISGIIDQISNRLLDWNSAAQLSVMLLFSILLVIAGIRLITGKIYRGHV
jgi:ABC-type spermidine/putrescine transport system permease subunit I